MLSDSPRVPRYLFCLLAVNLMKKLLMVAVVAALGVAGLGATSGHAADIAVQPAYTKSPAAPIARSDWTGCYAGGNVGSGLHRIDQTAYRNVAGTPLTPPLVFGSADGSAVMGGVQVGCDYQFAGNWVLGAQGMFNFGKIKSSNVITDPQVIANAPYQETATQNIYTGTARLGYLLTPQVLAYAKGGGAWTRTDTSVFVASPVFGLSESASSNRQGWTAGGGLEWMFAPNWSLFAEYDYMDFGRKDVGFTMGPNTSGVATVNSTRLTMQTALVGVNYKLNWGAALAAR